MAEDILKGLCLTDSIEINGQKVKEPICADSVKISGETVIVGNQSFTIKDKVINITVYGDVDKVCKGNNITVSGDVMGNVESAAGNIEVGGDVSGDVETHAGNITVKGDIMGDAHTSCGNIRR